MMHRVTLAGPATALLLAASFWSPWSAPVALVALIPWLAVVRRVTPRRVVASGALVATLFGCLWASWIPEAVRALGGSHFNAAVGLVATALWVHTAMFVLCGMAFWAAKDRAPLIQMLLASCVFGAVTAWMERSSVSAPVGLLGHTQRDWLGVAQVAYLGGIPLLSAFIVAINVSFTLWISRVPGAGRIALSLIAGWIGMATFGLAAAKISQPSGNVGESHRLLLVQPNLPHGDRWTPGMQHHNLGKVIRQTQAALVGAETPIDLVIWPENLLTAPIDTDTDLRAALQSFVDKGQTPLVTGLVRSPLTNTAHRYRSSVLWLEPQRGVSAAVDKERAIPFIESSRQPLPAGLVEAIFGPAARWPRVEEAGESGPLRGRFEIAATLCYETLFPQVVERRRTERTAFLLNLADESWVSRARLTQMLTDIGAFRAIEQRLPLVRVAHGGLTSMISPYGETLLELPLDQYATRVVEVRTPIAAAGDRVLVALPLVVPAALTYWLLGYAFRGNTKNSD